VRMVPISKALAILVTCLTLALGIVGPAWGTNKMTLSHYAPFPRAALTDVGASIARPTHAQADSVRVSVSRAYVVGLTQIRTLPKDAKVTVRLGMFRDEMQGMNVGTLSYAVIFDGVVVPSYGPKGGPSGHELVVIVNAVTGRSVEAFSYR